jgi:hypothetical protein
MDEWEERHGPGHAGQGSMYYEGDDYDVNFALDPAGTGRNADFVKRVWGDGAAGATVACGRLERTA